MATPTQYYSCRTSHHDPYWPEVSRGLKVVPVSKYTALTPSETNSTTLLLAIECFIVASTFNTVEAQSYTLSRDTSSATFEIDINNVLSIADQKMRATTAGSNREFVLAATNVSDEVYLACLERANEIAKGFFAKAGNPRFTSSGGLEELHQWKDQTWRELNVHILSNVDVETINEPLQFTDEQLKTFGVSIDAMTVEASTISCFDYSLLLAGETKARDLIFAKAPKKDSLEQLEDWNWRPVEAPNEGDMVVYLTNEGEALHFGYYTGTEGLIRSKFGNNSPISVLHRLFDVPFQYNNKVIFLRKSNTPLFDPSELALEAETIYADLDPSFAKDCEKELEKLEEKNVQSY